VHHQVLEWQMKKGHPERIKRVNTTKDKKKKKMSGNK